MSKFFSKISENPTFSNFKSITIKDFASGRIFLNKFLLRQGKLVLLIIVLIFFYMNNRMVCEKMLHKIDALNKELTTTKYLAIITETELLEAGREQEIEKRIAEKGLNLTALDMPPFIIKEEE
jgi:hypothetical protein